MSADSLLKPVNTNKLPSNKLRAYFVLLNFTPPCECTDTYVHKCVFHYNYVTFRANWLKPCLY